jgi:hypothetical protein
MPCNKLKELESYFIIRSKCTLYFIWTDYKQGQNTRNWTSHTSIALIQSFEKEDSM